MNLAPRLEIHQTQSLTLTPQLMQSIRLLQLGHLEINAFVEAELERNPLLERDETATSDGQGAPPENAGELSAYEDTVSHAERIQTATSIAGQMDTDVENVFPEQVGQDSLRASAGFRPAGGGGGHGEAPDIDQYVASAPTLADHLSEQAALIVIDPGERIIARHLIDNLDEAGYLGTECTTIAEQVGTSARAVETVLGKLQGCDPTGVFARDAGECLAMQLREKDRLDPWMKKLLVNLDLVAAHDMAALARAVGARGADLQEMLAELRNLDPKPGLAFDRGPAQAVVADVFVRRRPDKSWQIELNSDVLPRVLVNRTYYATVSAQAREGVEKAFLTDCLQTANWLTRSLDQRAQTIVKVAAEIVKQQDDFLVHGVTHLRPMTLKMVADAIDMHESTVSRVTTNKYMATPRGLLEMKYFFTTALGSTSGADEHSAESVRHRIRRLVDAEAPQAILSDDAIAAALQRQQGIEVARRTVAKYREGMNIPSSVIRRRQKRALAGA